MSGTRVVDTSADTVIAAATLATTRTVETHASGDHSKITRPGRLAMGSTMTRAEPSPARQSVASVSLAIAGSSPVAEGTAPEVIPAAASAPCPIQPRTPSPRTAATCTMFTVARPRTATPRAKAGATRTPAMSGGSI